MNGLELFVYFLCCHLVSKWVWTQVVTSAFDMVQWQYYIPNCGFFNYYRWALNIQLKMLRALPTKYYCPLQHGGLILQNYYPTNCCYITTRRLQNLIYFCHIVVNVGNIFRLASARFHSRWIEILNLLLSVKKREKQGVHGWYLYWNDIYKILTPVLTVEL